MDKDVSGDGGAEGGKDRVRMDVDGFTPCKDTRGEDKESVNDGKDSREERRR